MGLDMYLYESKRTQKNAELFDDPHVDPRRLLYRENYLGPELAEKEDELLRQAMNLRNSKKEGSEVVTHLLDIESRELWETFMFDDFDRQRQGYHAPGCTQIGYWRKFNALHGFIVNRYANGVDECQPIELNVDDLAYIRDVLRANIRSYLLETRPALDPEEELKPAPGFFFGGQEKDGWYWKNVRRTETALSYLLKTHNFAESRVFYVASW